MSLKAKLEAVIYAAEEPVTLAQLAALFAEEALEWKAAAEAVSADKVAEAAANGPLPPLNEEFSYFEQDTAFADTDEPVAETTITSPSAGPEPIAEPESGSELNLGAGPEPEAEQGADDIPEATDEAAIEAAEARRLARVRDRQARAVIREVLDELIASYHSDGRGVEIREIAGGYRMATKPECHDAVRMFIKSLKPALKLSLPALETLAVIAYKQPVTAPEVNEIRGVDSSGVFGSLLARKLIATAGRKPVIGRPILYKTTREFLLRFGLKDVAELPSMEEFEKMAAIELDEPEPESSSTAESMPGSLAGPEFDEAASEAMEDMPNQDAAPEIPQPGNEAEPNPAEAEPAAPSPTEQAETETSLHEQ